MGFGFDIPGVGRVDVSNSGGVTVSGGGSASLVGFLPGGQNLLVNDHIQDEEKRKKDDEAAADAAAATAGSRATLQQIQTAAQGLSQKYKAALPEYQKGLLDVAMKSNRSQLANKLASQNQDLASRGLITGGIAQGATAKASAGAKADLATQENQIQKDVADQSHEMDDFTANIGMNIAGKDQDAANQYFRSALENMQAKNQAYGAAGSALGSVYGQYLGSKKAGV